MISLCQNRVNQRLQVWIRYLHMRGFSVIAMLALERIRLRCQLDSQGFSPSCPGKEVISGYL